MNDWANDLISDYLDRHPGLIEEFEVAQAALEAPTTGSDAAVSRVVFLDDPE